MAEIPGFVPDASSTEQVECPVCYQEYNQGVKRPRLLECNHIFCTECLQKIQLAVPSNAISCPLCRHATPLTPGGRSLPALPARGPAFQTHDGHPAPGLLRGVQRRPPLHHTAHPESPGGADGEGGGDWLSTAPSCPGQGTAAEAGSCARAAALRRVLGVFRHGLRGGRVCWVSFFSLL
ncbi:E3 ubiquitin-protein ligase RNF152-like, partial [Huso huso]